MYALIFMAWITGIVFLCTGYDPTWLLVLVSFYFGRLTLSVELQAALSKIRKQRAQRARRI